MAVVPSCFCSFVTSMRIWTRRAASRFDKGSSNRKALGSRNDGASDRDALTLTAGEVARLALQIGGEIQRGGALHLRSISGRGSPAIFKPNAMLPRTLICG